MFCANCGTKLDDSAVFCGECGTKVEAVAAVDAAKEAVGETVAEVKEAVEPTPVAEPVKQEAPAESEAPAKKKGGKGKIVALIIVLVLLLAGGGVAVWYFTGNDYNSQKSMKQAEAAFAAGELSDAKDYYEAALDYDETLKDAYIKLADIAIQEGKFDSAIKTLKKGIRNTEDVEGAEDELTAKLEATYVAAIDQKLKAAAYSEALAVADEAIAEMNTPVLVQKKKDIYMDQITAMMVEERYWDAISIAEMAFEATSDTAFEEKMAEAYIMLAQQEMEYGNYDYAWNLIEQGLYEVDSQKLKDEKVTLFKRWIDSYIEEGDYYPAIRKAQQAFNATEDESFNEKVVEIYLAWADEYVANGEYENALDILREGLRETDSAELSDRMDAINASEVLIYKKVVDVQSGTAVVYSYNAKGQETAIQYLDEYGNISEIRTYTYDDEGNASEYKVYDGTGVLQSKINYIWAEVDGEKQCMITYLDGEERVLRNEIVDEEGKMLSYTEYNVEEGTARIISENTYDAAGNLLETITTIGDETIVQKNEYIYDEAGNLKEWVAYTDEGIMELREIYDEKGNTLQVLRYDEAGEEVVVEVQYTYDEAGRMLTHSVKSEDVNHHSEYTYNDAGEKVKDMYVDDNTGDETITEIIITKEGNVEIKETIIYFNGEETEYEKLVSQYDEEGRLVDAELLDKEGMLIASDSIEYDEKGNEVYIFRGIGAVKEEYSIINEYGFPQQ